MIIVSYDISDNKVRARFAKFLMQYGDRLQYSAKYHYRRNKI